MTKKILIVEDNKNIVSLLKVYLTNAGYTCVVNETGSRVSEIVMSEKIDMVLLDLMLPQADGFNIAKKLRKVSPIPIIIVTAKQEESDKLDGLELGADDYITKPFSPKELVARVNSLFRRVDNHFATLTRGAITIDLEAETVKHRDELIKLTNREYKLLTLFMQNPGKVYSRDYLVDYIYPTDEDSVYDRAIDVCITRLRKKIGDTNQEIIQTVRSSGYKLNDSL